MVGPGSVSYDPDEPGSTLGQLLIFHRIGELNHGFTPGHAMIKLTGPEEDPARIAITSQNSAVELFGKPRVAHRIVASGKLLSLGEGLGYIGERSS